MKRLLIIVLMFPLFSYSQRYKPYINKTKESAKAWILNFMKSYVVYEEATQIRPRFKFRNDTLDIVLQGYRNVQGVRFDWTIEIYTNECIGSTGYKLRKIEGSNGSTNYILGVISGGQNYYFRVSPSLFDEIGFNKVATDVNDSLLKLCKYSK